MITQLLSNSWQQVSQVKIQVKQRLLLNHIFLAILRVDCQALSKEYIVLSQIYWVKCICPDFLSLCSRDSLHLFKEFNEFVQGVASEIYFCINVRTDKQFLCNAAPVNTCFLPRDVSIPILDNPALKWVGQSWVSFVGAISLACDLVTHVFKI